MSFLRKICASLVVAALSITPALAQDEVLSDTGDTAWILSATALVLLMTLPGLSLFYGGLVRSRNFLSVLIQCMAIGAICSVLWVIAGYTIAFGPVTNGIVGSGLNWMLLDLGNIREDTTIPESAFAMFQMTFAVITPALMVGAWVERARFGWVVVFSALWLLVVYAPVTHWVWGGGWLSNMGVIDFAGGIVVHTTAGVSALVVAVMLGKRIGWPGPSLLPHSPALTVAGAGLLWVGWFGFNGGSALTATDDASSAIINTHIAASLAALVWILIERIKVGKSTAIGIATGAIAGLATITPAAGSVGPGGSVIIGISAGAVCFFAVGLIKNSLKIDDSLDVFAVHGVGGMLGSLLLAIFTAAQFGGTGYDEGTTIASQFGVQIIGIGAVALWSIIATVILGYAISFILPMRVSEDDERDGLDISSHGERAWDLD